MDPSRNNNNARTIGGAPVLTLEAFLDILVGLMTIGLVKNKIFTESACIAMVQLKKALDALPEGQRKRSKKAIDLHEEASKVAVLYSYNILDLKSMGDRVELDDTVPSGLRYNGKEIVMTKKYYQASIDMMDSQPGKRWTVGKNGNLRKAMNEKYYMNVGVLDFLTPPTTEEQRALLRDACPSDDETEDEKAPPAAATVGQFGQVPPPATANGHSLSQDGGDDLTEDLADDTTEVLDNDLDLTDSEDDDDDSDDEAPDVDPQVMALMNKGFDLTVKMHKEQRADQKELYDKHKLEKKNQHDKHEKDQKSVHEKHEKDQNEFHDKLLEDKKSLHDKLSEDKKSLHDKHEEAQKSLQKEHELEQQKTFDLLEQKREDLNSKQELQLTNLMEKISLMSPQKSRRTKRKYRLRRSNTTTPKKITAKAAACYPEEDICGPPTSGTPAVPKTLPSAFNGSNNPKQTKKRPGPAIQFVPTPTPTIASHPFQMGGKWFVTCGTQLIELGGLFMKVNGRVKRFIDAERNGKCQAHCVIDDVREGFVHGVFTDTKQLRDALAGVLDPSHHLYTFTERAIKYFKFRRDGAGMMDQPELDEYIRKTRTRLALDDVTDSEDYGRLCDMVLYSLFTGVPVSIVEDRMNGFVVYDTQELIRQIHQDYMQLHDGSSLPEPFERVLAAGPDAPRHYMLIHVAGSPTESFGHVERNHYGRLVPVNDNSFDGKPIYLGGGQWENWPAVGVQHRNDNGPGPGAQNENGANKRRRFG